MGIYAKTNIAQILKIWIDGLLWNVSLNAARCVGEHKFSKFELPRGQMAFTDEGESDDSDVNAECL